MLTNIGLSATGTYYVTFTYNTNKKALDQISIQVRDCCYDPQTPSTYLTGNISDIVASGIPIELKVAADGLIINQNYQFVPQTEITLLNNIGLSTSIYVEPSVVLMINFNQLHACNVLVENGIWLKPGATLRAENSYFRDALRMINAQGGSGMIIRNNKFHANDLSIVVPPPNNPQALQGLTQFIFENNEIECQGENLIGQSYKSYGGIEMFNIEYLQFHPSTANYFHDIRNGIILWDSHLDINNNSFENIQPSVPPYSTIEGNGIYADKVLQDGPFELEQTGFGLNGSYSFKNCKTGVFTSKMSPTIEDNNMVAVESGIKVESSAYRSIKLDYNRIQCYHDGIFLNNNDPSNLVLVSENIIEVDDITQGTGLYNSAGIKIYENGNPNLASPQIGDNIINVYTAIHGIVAQGTNRTSMFGNKVYLHEATANWDGINLTNCTLNDVYGNTIIGSGAYTGFYSSFRPRALSLISSTENTIGCNYFNYTYCGMSVEDICSNSTIRGNMFNTHNYGIRINPNGVTGIQYDKGNQWNDCDIPSGGLNQNTFFPTVFFTYNYCPYTPDNYTTLMFAQSNNEPYNCPAGLGEWENQVVEPMTNAPTSLDSVVAGAGLVSNDFQEEVNWMAGRYLYGKILNYPALNTNELFSSFSDSITEISAGLYQKVTECRKSANKIDSVQSNYLLQLYTQAGIIVDSVNHFNDLIRSGVTTEDSLLYLANISNLMMNYAELSVQIDALVTYFSQSRNSVYDSLIPVNYNLPDGNIFETNEKLVNQIYLTTFSNEYIIRNCIPMSG
ncbi:MAG: hypothetical protein NTU44_04295 [Bacteroidetes bacterium]|nr:hypothetical protein [Bacteroidota bacterium]